MEALAAHVSGLQRQMLGEGEEEGKLLAANAVSAANEYVAALFKGLEARVGGIATEVAAQRDDYAAGQSQLLAAVGKANTRLIVLAAAVGYDGQRLAEFIELYTRNLFRQIADHERMFHGPADGTRVMPTAACSKVSPRRTSTGIASGAPSPSGAPAARWLVRRGMLAGHSQTTPYAQHSAT